MEKKPELKQVAERNFQNQEREDEKHTLKYYLKLRMDMLEYTEERLAEEIGKDRRTIAKYTSGEISRPKSYKDALRLVIALKMRATEAVNFLSDIGHSFTSGNTHDDNRTYAYRSLLENPLVFGSVNQFNIFMKGLGFEGI